MTARSELRVMLFPYYSTMVGLQRSRGEVIACKAPLMTVGITAL